MLDVNAIGVFFLKPAIYKFEETYEELCKAHYATTRMSIIGAFYYKKTILHPTALTCRIPSLAKNRAHTFKSIEHPLKEHQEIAENLYTQFDKLENDYKKMFTPLVKLHINKNYQEFRDCLPDASLGDFRLRIIEGIEPIINLTRQNVLNTPLSDLLEYYYTLRIIYGNCNY